MMVNLTKAIRGRVASWCSSTACGSASSLTATPTAEDTMRVIRIEDSRGFGAYRVGARWGAHDRPTEEVRHPSPSEDDGLRAAWDLMDYDEASHWFFGFRDEEQMRNWFYKDTWLIALSEAGALLTVWEVPARYVLVGYTQAVFRKEQAVLVESRPLV